MGMSADDIAAQLALYQAQNRTLNRFSPQTSELLLFTIAERANTPEKVHRFQAVEIFNRAIADHAEKTHRPVAASVAHSWATVAQVGSQETWRLLYGEIPMPAPDIGAVLVDFMNDPELMGILGLQAGWTPDLKVIDPDLDLKANDLGDLS